MMGVLTDWILRVLDQGVWNIARGEKSGSLYQDAGFNIRG